MSSEVLIEQRLDAIEAAISELRQRMPPRNPDWIERIAGSMADEPAFDEIVALGREQRAADLPSEGD